MASDIHKIGVAAKVYEAKYDTNQATQFVRLLKRMIGHSCDVHEVNGNKVALRTVAGLDPEQAKRAYAKANSCKRCLKKTRKDCMCDTYANTVSRGSIKAANELCSDCDLIPTYYC